MKNWIIAFFILLIAVGMWILTFTGVLRVIESEVETIYENRIDSLEYALAVEVGQRILFDSTTSEYVELFNKVLTETQKFSAAAVMKVDSMEPELKYTTLNTNELAEDVLWLNRRYWENLKLIKIVDMNNPKYNAVLKSNGQEVVVYKRNLGGWVDYSDCKTIYKDHEIIVDRTTEVE